MNQVYTYNSGTTMYHSFCNNDQILDTISEIRWGNNNIFAASSWDGMIRFYETQAMLQSYKPSVTVSQVHQIDCDEPVISVAWKSDMSVVFAALSDNSIRAYDCKTGQSVVLGAHENCPACKIFWNEDLKLVYSLGLDQKLKFWNLQLPSTQELPKPAIDLPLDGIPTTGEQDCTFRSFIYADINQKFKWLEMEKLRGTLQTSSVYRSPFNSEESRLGTNSQITSVCVNLEKKVMGYASIDGRVAVLDIDNRGGLSSKKVFKAHKVECDTGKSYVDKIAKYYQVSSLQVNPRATKIIHVVTAGGEGALTFWDLEKSQRIVTSTFENVPVVSGQLSPDGQLYAFALGYDYAEGIEGIGEHPNKMGCVVIPEKQLTYLA